LQEIIVFLAGDVVLSSRGLGKGKARSEFPVSSVHESIKSARKSVREDLELRWVTNLSEERKRLYLIATLFDPRTKMLSFCDNKHFSSRGKTRVKHFFSWSLNFFIWSILKEKSIMRMDKSLYLAFWMSSQVSVAHQCLLDITLIDVMWAKQAP
jgi:hypothetical protein